jgi:hypothetical protein
MSGVEPNGDRCISPVQFRRFYQGPLDRDKSVLKLVTLGLALGNSGGKGRSHVVAG